MNMTEKFEHDGKDHTDEHERWNLTEKVDYDWLNLGLNTFKLRCKALFLTNQ